MRSWSSPTVCAVEPAMLLVPPLRKEGARVWHAWTARSLGRPSAHLDHIEHTEDVQAVLPPRTASGAGQGGRVGANAGLKDSVRCRYQ